MVIYVPGTEETDPKKQNMALQQLGGATSTNTTNITTNTSNIAANTAAISAINAAGYVVGPASATDNALVRFDATTGKLVQNSEILLGDSDGKLSRAAGISVAGTNTNDSAAAGYVGEYVESVIAQGSAVNLTTATSANVTSISLTAGDWDVSGTVIFDGGATTTVNNVFGSISTTSATLTLTAGRAFTDFRNADTIFANNTLAAPLPPARISLSGTTTVYLVAHLTFGVSTAKAFGIIRARRVR